MKTIIFLDRLSLNNRHLNKMSSKNPRRKNINKKIQNFKKNLNKKKFKKNL